MLKKGFTLIELIMVMGVIGVIVTALIVAFNPLEQLAKSRDARRKSDLEQIQKALELYYQDNNEYPVHTNDNFIEIDGDTVKWGEDMTPYIKSLPKDPSGDKTYVYFTDNDQQSYWVYASLDRAKDTDICSDENPCVNLDPDEFNCGSGDSFKSCNYGVSSPNVSP